MAVSGGGRGWVSNVDPTVEFFWIRRLRTVIRVTTVSANQKAVILCRGLILTHGKECFHFFFFLLLFLYLFSLGYILCVKDFYEKFVKNQVYHFP